MATTKINPILKPGTSDLDLYAERDVIAVEHNRSIVGSVAEGINAVSAFGERRDEALYKEHLLQPENYFMHNTGKIPVAVIRLNYHEFGATWPNATLAWYELDVNSTVNEKRLEGTGTSLISALHYISVGVVKIDFGEPLRSASGSVNLGFQCLCQVGSYKKSGEWETVINTCAPTALSVNSVTILKGSHVYSGTGADAKSAPFDHDCVFAIYAPKKV